MYRVVHLVEDNILLTLQQELHIIIRSSYCGRNFNVMSTNSIPRPGGPPCIAGCLVFTKLRQKGRICSMMMSLGHVSVYFCGLQNDTVDTKSTQRDIIIERIQPFCLSLVFTLKSLQVEGALDERAEDEKKDAEKDVDGDEAPKMFSIGQAETTDDEGLGQANEGFAAGQVRIASDMNQDLYRVR